MKTKFISVLLFLGVLYFPLSAFALVKGIYLTQSTLENTSRLVYLIEQAKATGIDTFVIDMNRLSKRYQENINLVHQNGIKYVARIVVFADGGDHALVTSQEHWEKRYQLAKQAIELGAKEIQLDYIRYNTRQPASSANAENVHKVIEWFRERIHSLNTKLQIDVFGITSFGEEPHIGQNVEMFAGSVDAICPMNYPSHFEPYRQHAVTPYETIHKALTSMKEQISEETPVKLYNYIELSNYRYPLSYEQKLQYIYKQIKATEDAQADGWYAWSASNSYDNLFTVLKTYNFK